MYSLVKLHSLRFGIRAIAVVVPQLVIRIENVYFKKNKRNSKIREIEMDDIYIYVYIFEFLMSY